MLYIQITFTRHRRAHTLWPENQIALPKQNSAIILRRASLKISSVLRRLNGGDEKTEKEPSQCKRQKFEKMLDNEKLYLRRSEMMKIWSKRRHHISEATESILMKFRMRGFYWSTPLNKLSLWWVFGFTYWSLKNVEENEQWSKWKWRHLELIICIVKSKRATAPNNFTQLIVTKKVKNSLIRSYIRAHKKLRKIVCVSLHR